MATPIRLSTFPEKACVLAVVLVAIALTCAENATAQTFTKTASPTTGASPLTVLYTYTFDNRNGRNAFVVDTPTDDTCSPVSFIGGDTNNDRKLDIGEIWTWRCTATLSATTVNTATTSARYGRCDRDTCTTTILDFIMAHATVTIPVLSVSINGRKSVCKDDTVTLTAVAAGGNPPYTFLWSNGAMSQAITPSTANPGTFQFGVRVSDSAGKSVSASFTLTVAAVCLTEVTAIGTPPELPLETTIVWKCGFSFAGRCFSQTIDKICIGGHCVPNPTSPDPPICPRCVLGAAMAVGGALGLIAGILLLRALKRPSSSSPSGARPI